MSESAAERALTVAFTTIGIIEWAVLIVLVLRPALELIK